MPKNSCRENSGLKVIVVIAAWSSGSTAVAGYLDACGAYSCPPHLHTNDGRTPNAFEPAALRHALMQLFEEKTLKEVGSQDDFLNFFENWWPQECEKAQDLGCSHIVLKQPLQTLILPYLHKRLDPTYVFVTRPLQDIEKTRVRRNWPPVYGGKGAKALYGVAFDFLVQAGCSYISVPFDHFRSSAALREKVLAFTELNPTEAQRAAADAFLRPS